MREAGLPGMSDEEVPCLSLFNDKRVGLYISDF